MFSSNSSNWPKTSQSEAQLDFEMVEHDVSMWVGGWFQSQRGGGGKSNGFKQVDDQSLHHAGSHVEPV